MPDQEPPPWDDDPLSELFKLSEYNSRVTSLNFPEVFDLLKEVELVFKEVQSAVEHDSKSVLLIPRFLIIGTHSSFLASIRLAMSGQFAEAYPVLRRAIEQAWYALHIAKDPSAPSRLEIWLCRNEGAKEKTKCKQEFTIVNVHATLEALDHDTARHLKELYESLIDYGAHPNQLGVLINIAHSKTDEKIDYQVGILNPKPLPMIVTIKLAIAVAIGTLKVFQLIFPERFEIMSIDNRIEKLIVKLNTVFKLYAQNKL